MAWKRSRVRISQAPQRKVAGSSPVRSTHGPVAQLDRAPHFGIWPSLAGRVHGVHESAGSNPAIPTRGKIRGPSPWRGQFNLRVTQRQSLLHYRDVAQFGPRRCVRNAENGGSNPPVPTGERSPPAQRRQVTISDGCKSRGLVSPRVVTSLLRGMAQPGSAGALEASGRRFESGFPYSVRVVAPRLPEPAGALTPPGGSVPVRGDRAVQDHDAFHWGRVCLIRSRVCRHSPVRYLIGQDQPSKTCWGALIASP